jgi:hypothetical protein
MGKSMDTWNAISRFRMQHTSIGNNFDKINAALICIAKSRYWIRSQNNQIQYCCTLMTLQITKYNMKRRIIIVNKHTSKKGNELEKIKCGHR